MTMLVSEKNRLGTAIGAVSPRIEAHIAWLEQELSDLDKGLRQALRRSPVWREKDDLLRTVPGVGEQLSLTLLANLPDLGTLNRRQIAALLWAWPPTTATVAPCGANAPSGANAPGAGRPLHGSVGSQPPQPCYPGLLPEAAGSWQAEKGGAGRVHAQTAGYTQRHAQTWLPLVRYDPASRRSFLLTFKTVAIGCSFSGVGLLFKNHYPRFRGAPFCPFRRPHTPTRSVDSGLGKSTLHKLCVNTFVNRVCQTHALEGNIMPLAGPVSPQIQGCSSGTQGHDKFTPAPLPTCLRVLSPRSERRRLPMAGGAWSNPSSLNCDSEDEMTDAA